MYYATIMIHAFLFLHRITLNWEFFKRLNILQLKKMDKINRDLYYFSYQNPILYIRTMRVNKTLLYLAYKLCINSGTVEEEIK